MLNHRKYRPNLSDIAYNELKEMIFSGELGQGERIVLEKMSGRLNLSITPLREALNKLAQEDLVLITPRSSYEIVSLSPEDVNDILDLREALETFALRTSGHHLEKFPVKSFCELFERIAVTQNQRKFIEADAKFHESIIALSKNRRLWKLFEYIRNSERLLMVPSARIEGRLETAVNEHLAILDAIEKKNVELAEKRLSTHIRRVKFLLLESLEPNKIHS